ncbi:MAG TPA: TolC family protein [Kofleriaceae bacterium]
MSRLTLCVALGVAAVSAQTYAQKKPEAKRKPVQTRPSTSIALLDILQVAIRQSPTLTRAAVDIDAARAQALAAEGLDDFTLTATGVRARAQRFTATGPGSVGIIQEDTTGLDIGLVRGLFTGGTLAVRAGGQLNAQTFRTDDGMLDVEIFDGAVANVSASLFQPILRGFGPSIARADGRRARVARDVASLQQAADALDITRDVIIGYWKVAYAVQVMEIRTDSLELANEQLKITERAVRSGSVSPTETLAAEQAIAVREQAVLLAEVEVSQLSLDLRRKVGLEIGKTEIDLAPSTPLKPPTQTFDTDATIARALAENPLLRLLEAKEKGAAIDVEVTEDDVRPRLDLHASVGALGQAGTGSEAVKEIGRFENPSFSVALNYEQQIGARAARGATGQAKAARKRLRIDLDEARREVSVSVAHAINLLRAAQKRIEVSDRAIALAKRNFEVQQTRFLNGKSTNFDVLLRQDELQQASVSRALAVTDALAAEATVNALTGDLLARNNIQIAPP